MTFRIWDRFAFIGARTCRALTYAVDRHLKRNKSAPRHETFSAFENFDENFCGVAISVVDDDLSPVDFDGRFPYHGAQGDSDFETYIGTLLEDILKSFFCHRCA